MAALTTSYALADTISNPTNTDSFVYLAGAGTGGGQQTQFVGETFTAPVTGTVTNFQFTLNSSGLPSLYGALYAWDGSKPTSRLWQSPVVSAGAGLLNFSPVGASVTAGSTYVAFLSTHGIDQNGTSNSGLATLGDCLPFAGCSSNTVLNLGNLVFASVLLDGPNWMSTVNNSRDATFSVTIASPVPGPIVGAGLPGLLMAFGGLIAWRRRRHEAAAA